MIDNTQDEFIKQAMGNVMLAKRLQPLSGLLQDAIITVDHATLSHCLVVLAYLIHAGDDIYLPIFERIKTELTQLEHNTELKDLAMNLVAKGAQNSLTHVESLH